MNTDRFEKMMPLEDVIDALKLVPLVGEGGMWSQPYSSDEDIPGGLLENRPTDRPVCSTIHFLLTPQSFSCMHRLVTDEVWYHHCGPAVKLLLIYADGTSEVKLLGQDLLNGERPQITVPRGTWQGAALALDGPYTLMSTSMAPAYQESDFETASYEELASFVDKENQPLLKRLTSEPVYR
jgi:predicted cupin superfamily sugar epimerase